MNISSLVLILFSRAKREFERVKMSKGNELTEALALDCEMVGAGHQGRISIAARVSLVNEYGGCVYDVYVKPTKPVTDYRTRVSGMTPNHLVRGRDFSLVKADVARHIKGRILVGHSVDKDLRVLGLCHPEWNVRDTSTYPPFQTRKGTPSLKRLAAKYLGWNIQSGPHSSVVDAKAVMMVYKHVEKEWEEWLQEESSEDESSEDESESDQSGYTYESYDYAY